jgi:hypothetical protein
MGERKGLADTAFRGPSTQNATFDRHIAPELYKVAMKFDFRAKMMVYAFMREPVALEIESGPISLF